jgi:hypothetical protein
VGKGFGGGQQGCCKRFLLSCLAGEAFTVSFMELLDVLGEAAALDHIVVEFVPIAESSELGAREIGQWGEVEPAKGSGYEVEEKTGRTEQDILEQCPWLIPLPAANPTLASRRHLIRTVRMFEGTVQRLHLSYRSGAPGEGLSTVSDFKGPD